MINQNDKVIVKEIPIPLVKINQGFFIIVTALALLLQSKYLVVFLFVTAICSLLFGPQANIAFRVAKPILAHRLFYAPTEAIEQQRFNQLIAVTCLGLSSLFFAFSQPIIGWIWCGFVTAAGSFSLMGYCLGCAIYYPYKLWVNRSKTNYPLLLPFFDFIAGTGIFQPPFQMKPQPLMLMGLAHESIRTTLDEIQKSLRTPSNIDLLVLTKKITDLNRFVLHHSHQEDLIMYPYIDKKSKGLTLAFGEEHKEIHRLEVEINHFINDTSHLNNNKSEFFILLKRWCVCSNKHLRSEEAVLMPKIPKLLTYKESNQLVSNILRENQQEYLDFHLAYAFNGLHPGQRYNYVTILKEASSDTEFKLYEAVLKPLIPEKAWAADFGSGKTYR